MFSVTEKNSRSVYITHADDMCYVIPDNVHLLIQRLHTIDSFSKSNYIPDTSNNDVPYIHSNTMVKHIAEVTMQSEVYLFLYYSLKNFPKLTVDVRIMRALCWHQFREKKTVVKN